MVGPKLMGHRMTVEANNRAVGVNPLRVIQDVAFVREEFFRRERADARRREGLVDVLLVTRWIVTLRGLIFRTLLPEIVEIPCTPKHGAGVPTSFDVADTRDEVNAARIERKIRDKVK